MKNLYNDFINIPNGSWIGRKGRHYDFGYNDDIILEGCNNFSYITGRLVALKKSDKIYIFSTKIIDQNGNKTIEKLAEFASSSPIVRAQVMCECYMYIIDNNCQVTFTNRRHIN